jgi:MFS family permease
VATAAIGLATAVWQVAVLRALAWMSRGIRSPARDMLLTSIAPKGAYGRAFGVERAGDNAGAIIGPLAASGLVALLGVRHAILLSIVPDSSPRLRSSSPPAKPAAPSPPRSGAAPSS